MIETVGLAMQSVIEHVYSADGTARAAAAATNIFMRTPSGWRLVCHHASPVTAVVMPQPTGPTPLAHPVVCRSDSARRISRRAEARPAS
jgi:hypothetical protein